MPHRFAVPSFVLFAFLAACAVRAGHAVEPRGAAPLSASDARRATEPAEFHPRVPRMGWTTAEVGTANYTLAYHDGVSVDAVASLVVEIRWESAKIPIGEHMRTLRARACAHVECFETEPSEHDRGFLIRRGDGSVTMVNVTFAPFNAEERAVTTTRLSGPSLEYLNEDDVRCTLAAALTLRKDGAAAADAAELTCREEGP